LTTVKARRDDTRDGSRERIPCRREAIVKFVITWTARAGGSGAETEAAIPRILALLSKWSPHSGETIHQFVTRADGNGGFAVVETDNLRGLALDNAKFSPYLDFSVYPVLDVQEGSSVLAEAAEFRNSVN
jgi:Protein of unknown function (DUF3303)